jgi:hypothetical protein
MTDGVADLSMRSALRHNGVHSLVAMQVGFIANLNGERSHKNMEEVCFIIHNCKYLCSSDTLCSPVSACGVEQASLQCRVGWAPHRARSIAQQPSISSYRLCKHLVAWNIEAHALRTTILVTAQESCPTFPGNSSRKTSPPPSQELAGTPTYLVPLPDRPLLCVTRAEGATQPRDHASGCIRSCLPLYLSLLA